MVLTYLKKHTQTTRLSGGVCDSSGFLTTIGESCNSSQSIKYPKLPVPSNPKSSTDRKVLLISLRTVFKSSSFLVQCVILGINCILFYTLSGLFTV